MLACFVFENNPLHAFLRAFSILYFYFYSFSYTQTNECVVPSRILNRKWITMGTGTGTGFVVVHFFG